MSYEIVDLETWPRAAQFRLFKTYDRPHYATTVRLDVTQVMNKHKADGISPYRASLYAIGAGVHAVPELLMRFQGDEIRQYNTAALSATVPTPEGSFNYCYLPFNADFASFDRETARILKETAMRTDFGANTGERDDLIYLSCMPWLDYTSLNNALPGPHDCIPRVSWGKIVETGGRSSMAMTLEVNHALVDGAQVGAYFSAVQSAFDNL